MTIHVLHCTYNNFDIQMTVYCTTKTVIKEKETSCTVHKMHNINHSFNKGGN